MSKYFQITELIVLILQKENGNRTANDENENENNNVNSNIDNNVNDDDIDDDVMSTSIKIKRKNNEKIIK